MSPRLRFAILTGTLLTAGCSTPQTVSIELRQDGESLLACESATVSELSPQSGGWRFDCSDGANVYLTYETDDTPARGSVERISVTPASGPEQRFEAYFLNAEQHRRSDFSCAAAEPYGERGPLPVPGKYGRVVLGTYNFGMAVPCAKLELIIGEPP